LTSNTSLASSRYRPEIDGLRALAVISVMFFHAGFAGFGGGFVGVDIFFVLSGYLITLIVISESQEKKLCIVDFYERRARRILPALLLVMFLCIPFAWFGMLPDEMENFGQSLVATSFFANNILLAVTAGYWDLASEYKPLLHAWSLGVEGQFYLVFPILIVFLIKGQRPLVLSLLVIMSSSLFLADWASQTYPELAFYLLPMRLWEFALGAIVAACCCSTACQRKFVNLPSFVSQAASLLGLFLVVFSVFFSQVLPHTQVFTH